MFFFLDVVGAVESVKAASEIYTPVSGEIVEVNEELSDSPELINNSPEEDGKRRSSK
jgi:glycine cleavage system H protein